MNDSREYYPDKVDLEYVREQMELRLTHGPKFSQEPEESLDDFNLRRVRWFQIAKRFLNKVKKEIKERIDENGA